MRTIETKAYTYDELSDDAKAKARDWLREANAGDNFFAEYITEDFLEVLKALGFDVDPKRGLAWSGFCSQGDGASFDGTWRAADCAPGKLLADRPAVYKDKAGKEQRCMSNTRLHEAATAIASCKADGLVSARINAAQRWGFRMSLDYAECFDEAADDYKEAPAELGERFIQAARDLASMFYRDLEAEGEYQNSDEQIAETIEANGYEFTEEGERA